MYDAILNNFLLQETAKLSQPVLDFVDNSVVIYDTGVDAVLDEQIGNAYRQAVEAIDQWMRMLVAFDSIENDGNVFGVTLELPNGTHEYECKSSVLGVVTDTKSLPMIHTPIGDVDYFIYRCIVDITENPVMLFYKAMQEQIHRVHVLITLDPDGYNDDLITPAILELCGIHDPLDICRLDSCLTHIDEFFDAHGFHEGWGSV